MLAALEAHTPPGGYPSTAGPAVTGHHPLPLSLSVYVCTGAPSRVEIAACVSCRALTDTSLARIALLWVPNLPLPFSSRVNGSSTRTSSQDFTSRSSLAHPLGTEDNICPASHAPHNVTQCGNHTASIPMHPMLCERCSVRPCRLRPSSPTCL